MSGVIFGASQYADVLNHLAAAMNVTTDMLSGEPDNPALNALLDHIGDAQLDILGWREQHRSGAA